ncbi:MAG: hypothetical protein ACRETQ_06170 [Gammaproteobacteria bacterium]
MNKLVTLVCVGALVGGFAGAACARGNPAAEIATAYTLALMARESTTIGSVHLYLHHVINCLVSPGAQSFDRAAGDPCRGEGGGAIPDISGAKALHDDLEAAPMSEARAGLQLNTLAVALRDDAKLEHTRQRGQMLTARSGYVP